MVWWPSRGAKRQETGVRIPLRSFFNWIEAPHGTETHLREKRLVCVPSPAFKIDYLTKYLSGPEPFTFCARDPRVRTSCCASQTCASNPPNLLLKENRPKKRASSLSRNIIGCYRFIPANTTCRSWIPMRVLHSKAPIPITRRIRLRRSFKTIRENRNVPFRAALSTSSCEQKNIVSKVHHPNWWRFSLKANPIRPTWMAFWLHVYFSFSTLLASNGASESWKHKPLRSANKTREKSNTPFGFTAGLVASRNDWIQRPIPSPVYEMQQNKQHHLF